MDTNLGDIRNYIDELKSRLDIVEIIERDEPLIRKGREWRGSRNHSLQVSPDVGLWRDWGEAQMGGDAIRWMELRHNLPFRVAVEDLARLAGMQPPEWDRADAQAHLSAQARYAVFDVAKSFFELKRRNCDAASRYCSRRGWAAATLDALHIGYFDGDYDGLRDAFSARDVDIYSPEAIALAGFRGDVRTWAAGHNVDLAGRDHWVRQGYIAGIPKHSLVFPHVELGRVRYFSTRSVCTLREEEGAFVVWSAVTDAETRHEFSNNDERKAARDAALKQGKRHYNLPKELTSPRIPYWNAKAIPGRGDVVVVEGQADAITLQQWNLPAVALAGCHPDDDTEGSRLLFYLAESLRKKAHVSVGTDTDDAGAKGAQKLAEILDPLLQVVHWPDHDANDWLQTLAQARNDSLNPTDAELAIEADEAQIVLGNARPYLLLWAERVGAMNDRDKAPQLDALVASLAKLSQAEIELNRKPVATATGLAVSAIDRMLKAKLDEDDEDDGDKPLLPLSTIGGPLRGYLIEMLYRLPEDQPTNAVMQQPGKTLLAVRDPEGHISIVEKLALPEIGREILPSNVITELLQIGTLILAPQVGNLLPTQELIERIRALIHKYVDVPEFFESLAAYYVLFSWFYDLFPTLSYLRLKGDPGTGKSRFLQVVGSLCYRPLHFNAGSSISSIFRTMNDVRGTLVLDEGDFNDSDEKSEIAKLFNSGNDRRQGFVFRSDKTSEGIKPRAYCVFGPKIIGMRKDFNDDAIASRCLTHETGSPTSRTDIPVNLPDTFWTEEIPTLQSMLLAYRMKHWDPRINEKEIPLDRAIERRIQQVTNSLRKMIDDPEMTAELQKFIRAYNREMVHNRAEQIEAKVLEALYITWETQQSVEEEKRNLSITLITSVVNDLIDFENGTPIERWTRYKDQGKRKSLTPRGVGNKLKNLQLDTHRPSRDKTRRYHVVWDQKRMDALWLRYGLDDDTAKNALRIEWNEIRTKIDEYEQRKQESMQPQAYKD